MELETRRLFFNIAQKFQQNNYTISTVSKIIVILRKNKGQITDLEAKRLLEIPINILKNDVEVINKEKWINENSSYFAGNVTCVGNAFQQKWGKKFYNGDFDLSDIIELTEIVKNNFGNYRGASEYLLRNAEATLRDDVILKSYSTFLKDGIFFIMK